MSCVCQQRNHIKSDSENDKWKTVAIGLDSEQKDLGLNSEWLLQNEFPVQGGVGNQQEHSLNMMI